MDGISMRWWLCGVVFLLALSSCSRHPSKEAQGYMEGRYTYMATPVSGVLTQLLVVRGASVKQGQALFSLEQEPESDAYQAAVANLKQAIANRESTAANLVYAKLTYERYKILVPRNAIQQSELDSAKATLDATAAQLKQANANIGTNTANLQQAQWTLKQKNIFSPVDAIVFDTYYRLGEYTLANQPILSLLAPGDIKAIFYIEEKNLGGITLGDKVLVKCDGCQKKYEGNISFISPTAEYTPPVIYSNETSAKLIYRIEAAFSLENAYQLHPGQPVRVTYYPHG